MEYLIFRNDPSDKGRPIVIDRKLLVKELKEYTTNHYVMAMVTRGEGEYTDLSTGKKYSVRSGMIMQRFVGRTHKVIMNTEENEQYYLRIPMEAYLACNLVQNLDATPCVFEMDLDEYVNLMDQFVDKNKKKPYQDLLIEIIPLVLKLHSCHVSTVEPIEGSEEIRKASRILTNDLKRDIDLEWLAESCGMSYKTFSRKFKEEFDCSPGAYRLKFKMDAADHYLKYSSSSIQEISVLLGYSNAHSFSRQFKKVFGISPLFYRQNNAD